MSTTSYEMPSRSSCEASRWQYPHQLVLYMVNLPVIRLSVLTSRVGPPTATPSARRPFRMSADDLLVALDPEQREVATALRGPVRVLAGAGTGKTRAITHRIAYGVASGVYNPMEVLAVTFTTRAAGETRTRLRSMGASSVQARTFHSAALRQVRYFWPRVYGGEPPQLIES